MSYRYPDEPGYPTGLFAGTAPYYARYRPGYPPDLVSEIFEADLRAALLEHDASGSYEETMPYYFRLGQKGSP